MSISKLIITSDAWNNRSSEGSINWCENIKLHYDALNEIIHVRNFYVLLGKKKPVPYWQINHILSLQKYVTINSSLDHRNFETHKSQKSICLSNKN